MMRWATFVICVILSARVNSTATVKRDSDGIQGGNSELAENALAVNDCIKNLQRPLVLATKCCLTRSCSDGFIRKLCDAKLPSLMDAMQGCHNLNSGGVNKDTNPTAPSSSDRKESDCGGNFQMPTIINGETAPIINCASTGRNSKGYIKPVSGSGSYVPAPNSGDKKIRFENLTTISARISGLQFLDVPKGDEMRIHDLRLEEEYLLFEAFSGLMGYLQPDGFPTDLARNALHNRVPFHLLAFQVLKNEITVMGWIFLSAILALCLPFSLLAHLCCSNTNLQRLEEDSSDISLDFREKCTERTLTIILHLLLLLIMIPLLLILAANEQISKQMSRSVATSNIIFEDLNTFIRNTHMQISFVATSSTDITIEAIRKDLEDVEGLLGRPHQEELASGTEIDRTLDALDNLRLATGEVVALVRNLLQECASARAAGNSLQEQLKEIARQLTIARQQCRPRDRTLCYTLQYTGLDVTFDCGNLTADPRIQHLERIGIETTFNDSIENARDTFERVPMAVVAETAPHIAEIKSLLSKKRTEVYKSAHSLDELTRSLSDSIRTNQYSTVKIVEDISERDIWRCLIILGISASLSLVWGLLLCGAPCGCSMTSKTVTLLLSGVSFAALMSLIVWSLGAVSLLIGGHGQSLLCQPLYDYPNYKTLAAIFNAGGALRKDRDFLADLFNINDSIKIEDALKGCQRNQPAYTVFHLNNVFDVNSVSNYRSWDDFRAVASNFTIGSSGVEILSPSLQLNLQMLATLSMVNVTGFRGKISGAVTRRDLSAFADQLNTVARQLTDPVASKRIDNLALMVRRVIRNEMARLNDLRDRILYKITALDVLINPLSKEANQSLAHLKTIQYFLDNLAPEIADKNARQFTSRIENYLEDLHTHINHRLTKEIGKCRPLWDLFHTTRFCICKLLIDPTNGISVASFSLILLFLGTAPVVLKLVERYKEHNEDLLTSITHRRARDGLIIDDEGTWATPSVQSPDVEMRSVAAWMTPGQSSEPIVLPPPPSGLATIASRISAARVPQIPTISRARSPRRLNSMLGDCNRSSRDVEIVPRIVT